MYTDGTTGLYPVVSREAKTQESIYTAYAKDGASASIVEKRNLTGGVDFIWTYNFNIPPHAFEVASGDEYVAIGGNFASVLTDAAVMKLHPRWGNITLTAKYTDLIIHSLGISSDLNYVYLGFEKRTGSNDFLLLRHNWVSGASDWG